MSLTLSIVSLLVLILSGLLAYAASRDPRGGGPACALAVVLITVGLICLCFALATLH